MLAVLLAVATPPHLDGHCGPTEFIDAATADSACCQSKGPYLTFQSVMVCHGHPQIALLRRSKKRYRQRVTVQELNATVSESRLLDLGEAHDGPQANVLHVHNNRKSQRWTAGGGGVRRCVSLCDSCSPFGSVPVCAAR